MADPAHPAETFDTLIARLREVVARLESGDLALEDSLAAYEQGVQLARRAQQLLAAAEQRVELLVTNADGTTTTQNFVPDKDA